MANKSELQRKQDKTVQKDFRVGCLPGDSALQRPNESAVK